MKQIKKIKRRKEMEKGSCEEKTTKCNGKNEKGLERLLVAKNTWCSSRRPRLDSQQP